MAIVHRWHRHDLFGGSQAFVFSRKNNYIDPVKVGRSYELGFERTFRNLQIPVDSLLLPSEYPYPVPAFPAEDRKQEQKPTTTIRNR